jgi:hypothetical protein
VSAEVARPVLCVACCHEPRLHGPEGCRGPHEEGEVSWLETCGCYCSATCPADLVVVNVTGIAEERGYRLFWQVEGSPYRTPALGLATSDPFRRERDAIAYGLRVWGERARRTQ